MRKITVKSSLVKARLKGDARLTPRALGVLIEIAAALDAMRIGEPPSGGIWLSLPSIRLRGHEGDDPEAPRRKDNRWLRIILDRLMHVTVEGDHKDGGTWGATVIAEWHIKNRGALVHILIPPAAARALTTARTFSRLDAAALHSLKGYARRLYVALGDLQRLQGQHSWTYDVDALREVFGVSEMRAYRVWGQFRKGVLLPALAEIAEIGIVDVTMTQIRTGRRITAVRFDWTWKTSTAARAQATRLEASTAEPAPENTPAALSILGPADGPPDAAAEAREWWRKTDRKTRKYTLLRLGIANPGSEDLHDESPYALEAWQLIRDLKAPPEKHA